MALQRYFARMPSDERSDDTLLRLMCAGDTVALDGLVLRFYKPLRHFILPIVKDADTADDVLQDLFVRLWNQRGTLVLPRSVRAYLYAAARNSALNAWRRQANRTRFEHSVAWQDIGEPHAQDVSQDLERKEFQQAVDMVVATLPDRAREVYLLSQQHGLTYREIAETLGIALPTVKTHMARSIATLERKLRRFLVLTLSILF